MWSYAGWEATRQVQTLFEPSFFNLTSNVGGATGVVALSGDQNRSNGTFELFNTCFQGSGISYCKPYQTG